MKVPPSFYPEANGCHSNQLYGRLVQISDREVRNWSLGQQVESRFATGTALALKINGKNWEEPEFIAMLLSRTLFAL